MRYITYLNSVLQDKIKKSKNVVLFGQNINAASCIGGLTSDLGKLNSGLTINAPNCENTLVGAGFGLMLNGVSSIFFMKQTDFLLLGIDHLVNSFNIIRQQKPRASFTIFPISVDSGYEGPQSALNNLNDFCSIAGIKGYSFTNKQDTKLIISKYLIFPGFRILSPSQRLLSKETLNLNIKYKNEELDFFQYYDGNDVTVLCFNFSLPYGIKFLDHLTEKKVQASLFSINSYTDINFAKIIHNLKNTRKLVIIDDTKSRNSISDKFCNEIQNKIRLELKIMINRKISPNSFYPNHDKLKIDYEFFVNQIVKNNTSKEV